MPQTTNPEISSPLPAIDQATGRKPILVTPESARYSHDNVGSEYIGWLHFQPIWEQLLESQPDMLG